MKNLRGTIEGIVENYQPEPEVYKPVRSCKRPLNPVTGWPRAKIRTASVFETSVKPVIQMSATFRSTHN